MKLSNLSMMSSFFRIPQNLRPVVYYYGVASGGFTEWHFVYNKYQQTVSSTNEKAFLMSAMAATKQSWILTRYSPVTKRVGIWVRNATAKHAWIVWLDWAAIFKSQRYRM
jgi:hypothetical protein